MGQSLKKVFCQRGIVVAILQRSLAANIQVFGYAKGDLDIPPQPLQESGKKTVSWRVRT